MGRDTVRGDDHDRVRPEEDEAERVRPEERDATGVRDVVRKRLRAVEILTREADGGGWVRLRDAFPQDFRDEVLALADAESASRTRVRDDAAALLEADGDIATRDGRTREDEGRRPAGVAHDSRTVSWATGPA